MRNANAELDRLRDLAELPSWRRWGPYLADRQCATVREDYSAVGNSWAYFPFAHAHRRAYRWGEDGLAGVSDDGQRLCLALVLWNGRDPILKERLFGLANEEGNHGEDVKELYYHLDAAPTHSYLKFLTSIRTRDSVRTPSGRRAARGRHDPEFELLDTGVFGAIATSTCSWSTRRSARATSSASPHNAAPRPPTCTCSPPSGSAIPGAGERRAATHNPPGRNRAEGVHPEWDEYRFCG